MWLMYGFFHFPFNATGRNYPEIHPYFIAAICSAPVTMNNSARSLWAKLKKDVYGAHWKLWKIARLMMCLYVAIVRMFVPWKLLCITTNQHSSLGHFTGAHNVLYSNNPDPGHWSSHIYMEKRTENCVRPLARWQISELDNKSALNKRRFYRNRYASIFSRFSLQTPFIARINVSDPICPIHFACFFYAIIHRSIPFTSGLVRWISRKWAKLDGKTRGKIICGKQNY